MIKLVAQFLALTLLLTVVGLCIPIHEGEGGGGAEGCFTGCNGRVLSDESSLPLYLSGPNPFGRLWLASPSSLQRYHSGLPYPALVADIGQRVWWAKLQLLGVAVNFVCAGVLAICLLSLRRRDQRMQLQTELRETELMEEMAETPSRQEPEADTKSL